MTGRALTFGLFLAFILITLAITVRARATTRGADDFYAGGRTFTGPQNGIALAGDYMSAASFLGIAGIIALNGYDGFLYSIGFLVAWLLALLLVEMVRNAGRFTMGDVLVRRVRRQAPVRRAAAVSTVTVSVFYLLAQMVGAGALVSLLLGIHRGERFLGMGAGTAKTVTIVAVGALMILYVAFGGMKATTWVQIIKTGLLMAGAVVLTALVLGRFGFDAGAMLGSAADASGKGGAFLRPGLQYGQDVPGDAYRTVVNKLDFISLALALVLGTVGLPHVVARFFAVPDGRAARTSVSWAIGLVGVFYLMTLALGFGAAALVGRSAIVAQDPSGNTAVPQLAQAVGQHVGGRAGGDVMLAFIGAVAFATILAVVSGLVLASSTSLAHDYFGQVLMLGRPRESQEVAVARFASFLVGSLAIVLAVVARDLNVAFLVALAFAMAASANVPAIVLSLFWRRFNSAGVVAGIYGGLVASLVLVVFSPVVSGKVDPVTGESLSLFPSGVDFHLFPLENPGLVSIPIGFACAVAGTFAGREKADRDRYDDLSVRALTGAGSQ
ncbi:solute symporter family protein [Actinomadura citrea]|uniref:Cation/acetate symporter n=1 Tax=Actinomadura citrea TaxID=46158 RepID=A0A7Y9G6P3_9ACTN|nr:cation acetate symporter [Actinomadura citrea]NYE10980.1 cation/acetate symporter [Actinomadura citrea]GGU07694.1 cation acetate symporter [Actinomadura citrea]